MNARRNLSKLFALAIVFGLSMSVPARTGAILVSPPPTPTQLPVEGLLTALTKKITATALAEKITASDRFANILIPGQKLDVRLNLPPELGGATALIRGTISGGRRVRTGVRGGIGGAGITSRDAGTITPVPTPTPGRTLTETRRDTLTGTLDEPVRIVSEDRVSTYAGAIAAGPTDDIPCELLPTGCPPPVPVPDPTAPPDAPKVQLSNFFLQVKWGVIFENGGPGTALLEDTDFRSDSIRGIGRSFMLAPLRIEEYTGTLKPPTDPFTILALVTVTADKTVLTVPPTTTKVTSAAVPVEVPLKLPLAALEVPRVFVLFKDKLDANFNGGDAAAIYLPGATALNGPSDEVEKQLFAAAKDLYDAYKGVEQNLRFVAWLGSYLTGLDALRKVSNLPHVSVKERKDTESNLNDDDFIYRTPVLERPNDIEVEDESSALLLLGTPGTQVQFFQDRGLPDKGGRFDVQTSNPGGPALRPPTDYAPGILIRDFDNITSEPLPDKVSISRKFMVTIPVGGFPPTFVTREVTPNDRLSSFRWVKLNF